MPKRKSVKTAKKKAWAAFSRYIRLRDCLNTTGLSDEGVCCTCGKRLHFDELQAGHFLDGRGKGILFSEAAVHAQCSGCNLFKSGNKDAYWPYMIEKYGQGRIDELIRDKKTSGTWTVDELERVEQKYKDKEAELARDQP